MRKALPLALVAALLFAGCSDAPDAAEDAGESITVVTDPNQGRLDPTMGEHLHDYWGSKQELTIVDETIEVGGVAWSGESIVVAEFRPAEGAVVPQGASAVRATITWTDADGFPSNNYGRAELWAKRADDNEPKRVAEVAKGDTVVVPSGNESNDLPHQVLSAWAFQLVLYGNPQPTQPFQVQYSGDVTLQAVAIRGDDPIPLFPGHPDRWEGRTEIRVLEVSGDVTFDGNTATGNWRCYGGCPSTMVPDDGAVVPVDADHVTVVLERTNPANPTRLGIKYHDALTRDFTAPAAMEETPTMRTYTIPVEGGGDGPYAKQSQWEFIVYAADPMEDMVVTEAFTITITAHRNP